MTTHLESFLVPILVRSALSVFRSSAIHVVPVSVLRIYVPVLMLCVSAFMVPMTAFDSPLFK